MAPRNSRLLEQRYTLSDGKHNNTQCVVNVLFLLPPLYRRILMELVPQVSCVSEARQFGVQVQINVFTSHFFFWPGSKNYLVCCMRIWILSRCWAVFLSPIFGMFVTNLRRFFFKTSCFFTARALSCIDKRDDKSSPATQIHLLRGAIVNGTYGTRNNLPGT